VVLVIAECDMSSASITTMSVLLGGRDFQELHAQLARRLAPAAAAATAPRQGGG
jgi:DNA-binding MurR/RpiR family transcriptional regulator